MIQKHDLIGSRLVAKRILSFFRRNNLFIEKLKKLTLHKWLLHPTYIFYNFWIIRKSHRITNLDSRENFSGTQVFVSFRRADFRVYYVSIKFS